jgi:5,5'-dehydrodivanillate O-demethylase
MRDVEKIERLIQVGPGTPGGALLRRYWQPLCVAAELSAEKPKKRVKILGEELVVFLDSQGQYGCVAEACSHRGVSLYYGFVEDGGIRCSYHGWKYGLQGECLEQPFEPRSFKQNIHHPGYPVQKLAGILFVYMGPAPAPLLPRWDVLVRTDGNRKIELHPVLNCNWLQAQENTADTVHTYYLHGHMMKTLGLKGGEFYYRPVERYDWEYCEWGIKKVVVYGGDQPEEEVRPPLLFPNMLRVPQGPIESLHWRVPIDDSHTRIIWMGFTPSRDGSGMSEDADPPFEQLPSMMTADGDYELNGFYEQDKMAWETQGPVFDRTKENLGATDRGIIMLRKLLDEQITLVEQGKDPLALIRDPEKNRIIEFSSTQPVIVVDGERRVWSPQKQPS